MHEYTGTTALDWQQEYVYDRYGNRTIEGNVLKTFGAGVNSAQIWLGKLNQFNGNFVNAEMVKAFIISGEYRQRFGH